MSKYDEILDAEKGSVPKPSDKTQYDSVLDDEVQQNQARTRTVYEKALTVNPDQAAQAKKLAGTTGLAPDIVARNLDEAKRKEQARALDLIQMAQDSPVLARQLMDPTFTNQAHDDLSTLGSIEQFIRDTGSSVKAGVYNANKGAAGVFQAGFEFAAPALDALENVAPGGNPLRRIAEGFALSGQGADALAKAATPQTNGALSGGFQSGIQSLTQNTLMLPMAFLPGGQGAALTGMVSLTGGQSYQDARAKGLSMSQALPFAASQAAIEYATEKLPLESLVGGIKAGAPFLQTLAKQMALEIPGEQIATALQDMNEWAVLNPGKPFKDYLAERPNAALQTLIATVVGTGGNVVIANGVQAATNRLMGDAYDAGQAEHGASYLQQQLALAGQALLRERNPGEFRALVQKMSEESDGAPKELFVDAEVLNQLAPEVLAALPESVRAALPDALWANDSVAIPVADVLTVAPGTELEQMLVENARIGDPRAMSQKEAKDAGAKAQEYLAQESARVIQQAQDQAATQASSDAVRQSVLDQLNGIGRFRKEVNEGYATWTAAFYTTMAGRMGMTPEAMAAQYPLRIVGQGQGELEQRAPRAWYHGTTSNVDKFNRTEGGNMWGPGYYLTDNPDTASGYATGTAGNRIAPEGNAGPNVMPVRVANGTLFDMSATLDAKTFKKVEKALGKKLKDYTWPDMKNRDLRQVLFTQFTDQAGANAVLQKAGFKGLVEESPTAGPGKTLMVFDPKDISSNITGQTLAQSPTAQTDTPAFKTWFGDSKVVDAKGKPLVVYHGSPDARFANEDGIFATLKDRMLKYGNTPESKRDAAQGRAFFFTSSKAVANSYADDSRAFDYQNAEAGVIPTYVSITNPLGFDAQGAHWREAQKNLSKDDFIKRAKKEGHDGVIIRNVRDSYASLKGGKDPLSDVVVAFTSNQIKSATSNNGEFNPNDPSILKQGGARGTFNPANLELALNDTADLSTFLHETGHFFLEVMDDLASQPNAPADITSDMNVLLKWFGIRGGNTYQGLTEDEYIAHINPDGKTREFTEAMPATTFAELAPTGPAYEPVGDVTLAPGEGGAVLAIVGGKVVGYMAPEAGTTGLFVADEFRGKGIGEALSTFYRTRNPLAPSGGFSASGEAVARKVFRKLAAQESGPVATWNAMTLEQKRPYHERFAESMEQYLMEGKAPSVELQPLFRKFRAWLLNVYKSLKGFIASRGAVTSGGESLAQAAASGYEGKDAGEAAEWTAAVAKGLDMSAEARMVFDPDNATSGNLLAQGDQPTGPNIQLSPEVRQVFDRMLASEEQIAQANEVAGLLPDEDADYAAVEKLTARSLRDLKWTVNARAKEIKKLQTQAKTLRKEVEAEVRAEVDAMPAFQARDMLDKTRRENKTQLNDTELAIVADTFQYPTVEDMLRDIDAAGRKVDMIEGMTDQRMLERHGDLIDQRAIEAAANEAVHNEARARSLATELKSQGEMLNARTDTGQTNANGSKITVSALAEAAKQFGANVVSKTPLKDLKAKAWQHTAAERRAGKRWQEATAAGKTQEAVKAKQDQMLNNAAAKAAVDAQAEMRKMLEFFKRVIKDGNEKTIEKGRDPDVVNAARAVLGAYGIAPKGAKSANDYMALVEKNDPAMFAALQPSVQGALDMAQPLDALTMDQLRGLHEEIQGMWYLAKRSRQMEVDGDMMDMDDAESQLQDRMQVLGVPDTMPGDSGAVTTREEFARKLQHAASLLRRTEQWAQGMGNEFTKLVFQPVKDAADRYRADRVAYRKKYQALVDAVAPALLKGEIKAPELGYTFGKGHNGIGHAELLHAILHTGNESNKRKLLLGRNWTTQNEDGTLDTTKWDAFIKRAHDTGILNKAHYDFAQGVWDLLEETKPLAQKTHRDVFGRYFAEVTADSFETPFGTYKGGYVPAQADPRIVADADLRKLAELENENMSFSFPGTNKGFTKSRVEYNRPLMLDLRTIGQHIDKVLLFSHMEPAVRDVNKLLSRKGVSYSLSRIDPTIYAGMLTPWLNRSARQIVETPIVGDGGISRVLSAARSRAGMSLMFANVSNTIQQITGFSTAALMVKPTNMMAATAQFITSPKKMAKAVSGASSFMADRMDNEVSAINEAMNKILLDPNLYERAQAWTQKHAYFMQTAMANTMEPIIWTAAYNEALQDKQSERDAIRHADSVIRTTQGSTLPEDVSRIETGPAYARVFTQFIGYFNMMANTNATALKQLAQEEGLRKGAGKALGIVTVGMLIPIWAAEAIAVAMRGGPDDPDKDGYLDDWLAAVFGMGTIKGAFAMVPFVGQLATASMNRFNGNPADDKMSLSPAVGILEAAAGVPMDVYKAITDPDKLNRRNAVRDVASAVSIATGFPASALARPVGYLAGVADNKIHPTGAVDAVRGTVTGTPSPGSK